MIVSNRVASIKYVEVSVLSFILLLIDIKGGGSAASYHKQVELNPTAVEVTRDVTSARVNASTDVRFLFYNDHRSWKNPFVYNVIKPGDLDSVYRSGYTATLPVKILVHGWTSAFQTAFPQNVRTAYLRRYEDRPVNVIVMDWGPLVSVLYSHSVTNSVQVGEHLGKFLCWLHKSHLIKLRQTHLIGLSLGCAVIGKAGDTVRETCGQLVGRITGLDPARPRFEPPSDGSRPLSPEDAAYVDIIHTGSGRIGWGMVSSSGHTDFFINGGKVQPNCSEALDVPTCNHVISASYFSQTIIYEETFGTCACRSAETYKRNPSCCHTRVVFGERSDGSIRGDFYLNYTLHGSMEGEPSPVLNLPW